MMKVALLFGMLALLNQPTSAQVLAGNGWAPFAIAWAVGVFVLTFLLESERVKPHRLAFQQSRRDLMKALHR